MSGVVTGVGQCLRRAGDVALDPPGAARDAWVLPLSKRILTMRSGSLEPPAVGPHPEAVAEAHLVGLA